MWSSDHVHREEYVDGKAGHKALQGPTTMGFTHAHTYTHSHTNAHARTHTHAHKHTPGNEWISRKGDGGVEYRYPHSPQHRGGQALQQ